MKKLLVILCALLVLCGCSKTEETQPEIKEDTQKEDVVIGNNTINPMTEVASLDELNELVGGRLNHPGVMGVDNEKFFTIKIDELKTIGEYNFTINDSECTLRFCDRATKDEDISGIYVDGGSAFPSENTVKDVEYNKYEDINIARWFNVDGQYTFAYKNEKCTEKEFQKLIDEMVVVTAPLQGEVK